MHYRRPGQAGDGLWSAGSIGRLLKNPVYAGTMVQGRQEVVSYKVHETRAVPEGAWFVVEDTHPAPRPTESISASPGTAASARPPPAGRPRPISSRACSAAPEVRWGHEPQDGQGLRLLHTCSTHRRKSKTACTPHTIRADRLRLAAAAQLGVSPEAVVPPPLVCQITGNFGGGGGEWCGFFPWMGEASFHLTKI
ncbi:MAG: recombinase family protein [Evtepia sp.]